MINSTSRGQSRAGAYLPKRRRFVYRALTSLL
jgi:hypothetical protein